MTRANCLIDTQKQPDKGYEVVLHKCLKKVLRRYEEMVELQK